MNYKGFMKLYMTTTQEDRNLQGAFKYEGEWQTKHREIFKHPRKYTFDVVLTGLYGEKAVTEVKVLDKVTRNELDQLLIYYSQELIDEYQDDYLLDKCYVIIRA